jgi:hypothetical protein
MESISVLIDLIELVSSLIVAQNESFCDLCQADVNLVSQVGQCPVS